MTLRKLFSFSSLIFLFLFSCKQEVKEHDKITIKLSFKVDSLIHIKSKISYSVDSLRTTALNAKTDTALINALIELSYSWGSTSGFILINEALKQSKLINYPNGIANSICTKGNVFLRTQQPDSAQKYFIESGNYCSKNKLIALQEQAEYWQADALRQKFHNDSALVKLFKIAEKTKVSGNKRILANSYYSIAEVYRNSGKANEAIKYSELTLPLFDEVHDMKRKATSLSCLADSYNMIGQYNKALEFRLKSIDIIESIGDAAQLALAYTTLGQIYFGQEKFDKAKEYYQKSMVILRRQDNKSYLLFCLITYAQALSVDQEFKKAEELLKEGIGIAQEKKDIRSEAECWGLMGELKAIQKKFKEALPYFKDGLKLAEQAGDINNLVYCQIAIGNCLLNTEQYSEAASYLEKGLKIAQEYEAYIQVKDAAQILYKTYEKQKQFEKAFKIQSLYMATQDSITNEEQIKKFADIEYSAKEAKLKMEQEKKNMAYETEQTKKEAEIKSQKTQRNAFIAGFVLLLVLAFVIFRNLQQNKKKNKIITEQKEILQNQKTEITDSINYAKRIQNAILPDRNDINKHLPNSFGLYKPKDIVSGDFYYFKEKNNALFLGVGDCTGHGVPGAFMSVVGSKELQIAVEKSDKPGEILSILNKGVKQALKQNTAEATKDGMDISLCKIEGKKITYSGANRPLWIVRKDSLVIEEYTATKTAIGGFTDDDHVFIEHYVELKTGDTFYLFTDGYADQFGGDKQKKMTTRRLKETLLSIKHLNMDDQKVKLESYLESWKGSLEQVDDVLIVGVRV